MRPWTSSNSYHVPVWLGPLIKQLDASEVGASSFEERLGLPVDLALTERHSRQLTNRLGRAPS